MDISACFALLRPALGTSSPRRRWFCQAFSFALVLAAALALQTPLKAADLRAADGLPGAASLAAQLTAQPDRPAIVLVSLPGCAVCEVVRREQLAPLLRDQAYQDVGVFEISMRDETSVLPLTGDWAGVGGQSAVTPARLSQFLGLRMAPTVLFINRRTSLAEPLIGYPSRDFYWSFLSDRIDTARSQAVAAQSAGN